MGVMASITFSYAPQDNIALIVVENKFASLCAPKSVVVSQMRSNYVSVVLTQENACRQLFRIIFSLLADSPLGISQNSTHSGSLGEVSSRICWLYFLIL